MPTERIILHVDMNSYFASVEQQANPLLRGKPIGVTGKRQERSVVAAASREAKKLGVKTAMATWEAKRILPSIVIVPGDPEKYGEITSRFNAIFREFTDRVEMFSVDESFLDVTDCAHDYLGAAVIAHIIKQRLREACGEWITASIGVGPNKLVAKAASECMKPDGLVIVRPEQVLEFLSGLDLQDICGIGPRIARRLDAMGITSMAQLRACPPEKLIHAFNSYGLWLHHAAHGRDDSEVSSADDAPKSVGHSYTFPKDLQTPEDMKRGLLGLCDKVAWRLRRDGFSARCVSVYARFGNFSGTGKQHRFREPINDGLALFRIAWRLLRPGISRPVRLLGVSASELTSGPEQPSLFIREQKIAGTLKALDRLQTRFGDRAWTRASLLRTEFLPRTSGFHYDHEI